MQLIDKNGKLLASYGYDDNSNRTSVTYSSGVTSNYAYNKANFVTSLENKNASTTLSKFDYTYYLDGNQATKTDSKNATTQYLYDDLGRLKTEQTASEKTVYSYDLNSNRIAKNVTGTESFSVGYAYDKANKLLQEATTQGLEQITHNFVYDDNGNLTFKAKEIVKPKTGMSVGYFTLSDESGWSESYSYNAFNQSVGGYMNGKNVQYDYRPDGLRNSKMVDNTTTTHLWNGQNVVADVGETTVNYVRGLGLIANDLNGANNYYLFNAHGDTVQLIDEQGNITNDYTYDAFGNQEVIAESDNNPFRYAGEYFDFESGNIYLRARYYDTNTGRFTQLDPARDGANWYVYCNSNPVKYIDPTGNYYIMASGDNSYKLVADSYFGYSVRTGVSALPFGTLGIKGWENSKGYEGGTSMVEGVSKNTFIDGVSLISSTFKNTLGNISLVYNLGSSIINSGIVNDDKIMFALFDRGNVSLTGTKEFLQGNIDKTKEYINSDYNYFYSKNDGYNTTFEIDLALSQSGSRRNAEKAISTYKAKYFMALTQNNPKGAGHMSMEEMRGYEINYGNYLKDYANRLSNIDEELKGLYR